MLATKKQEDFFIFFAYTLHAPLAMFLRYKKHMTLKIPCAYFLVSANEKHQ